YTLSLHDALPILRPRDHVDGLGAERDPLGDPVLRGRRAPAHARGHGGGPARRARGRGGRARGVSYGVVESLRSAKTPKNRGGHAEDAERPQRTKNGLDHAAPPSSWTART